MERESEADKFYQEASKRGAKDYMILINKARVYYLKGDQERAREYLLRLRSLEGLPLRMKELIK
jgi:Flp pilus assembly protein TadD